MNSKEYVPDLPRPFRTNVRILKPPGGSTHDIFGTDRTYPIWPQRELEAPKLLAQVDPSSVPIENIDTKESSCQCDKAIQSQSSTEQVVSKRKKNMSENLKALIQPELNPSVIDTPESKVLEHNQSTHVSEIFNYDSNAVWHPYVYYAEDHHRMTGGQSPFETLTSDMLKKKQEQRLALTPHHHWNSYVFSSENEPMLDKSSQWVVSNKGQSYIIGRENGYQKAGRR